MLPEAAIPTFHARFVPEPVQFGVMAFEVRRMVQATTSGFRLPAYR